MVELTPKVNDNKTVYLEELVLLDRKIAMIGVFSYVV